MVCVSCASWLLYFSAFFIGMLNSFVHIFMYGYYALASLGPQMHRYLWWKRYLTIMQLVINSMCSSLCFCVSLWWSLLSVSDPSPTQVLLSAANGSHHILTCLPVPLWEVNWSVTYSEWYSQKTSKMPSVIISTNKPPPLWGEGERKIKN